MTRTTKILLGVGAAAAVYFLFIKKRKGSTQEAEKTESQEAEGETGGAGGGGGGQLPAPMPPVVAQTVAPTQTTAPVQIISETFTSLPIRKDIKPVQVVSETVSTMSIPKPNRAKVLTIEEMLGTSPAKRKLKENTFMIFSPPKRAAARPKFFGF